MFEREYLNAWQEKDEAYTKAEMLWLWYDYQTEIFDRSLLSAFPDKLDDTMVTFHSPLDHSLAGRNAASVRKEIMDIARFYKIPDEVLQQVKMSMERMRSTMQSRIVQFVACDALGYFDFITAQEEPE